MEELQSFGRYLRDEREQRQMPLEDISLSTRIPVHMLECLEQGHWSDLPAEVFVRGYVRSYARQVGFCPEAAVERLCKCLRDIRDRQLRAEIEEQTQRQLAQQQAHQRAAEQLPWFGERRRFSLALFVIILLIIATITFSLIWRHGATLDTHANITPSPSTLSEPPRPLLS